MLSHVSLFSGLGAFDYAAERAGFKTVMLCEIDLYCQRILKHHWPGVPIINDVKEVTKERIDECMTIALDKKYVDAPGMYESGQSIGQIAEHYGVTRQAMWKILQRRNVQFRPKEKEGEDNHFYRGGSFKNKQVRSMVQNEIEQGRLTKQPCEICGSADNLETHHDDYNKPLEVTWVCKKHHYEWHETHRAVPQKEAQEGCNASLDITLLTASPP